MVRPCVGAYSPPQSRASARCWTRFVPRHAGCPSLVAELAGQALPTELCAHVVVPLAVELASAERVCMHGRLLSA